MYDDEKWKVGTKWLDTKTGNIVTLVYCRNVTDFAGPDGVYGVLYRDLAQRMFKVVMKYT